MAETRNKKIEIRLSEPEKMKVEESAKCYGMNVSDFVRTLALSDKKILVLASGSEIARSLVQIHIELQNAQKNGVLSNKYTLSLLQSMEELIEAFNAVSEQLTDIRSNDEEDA